MTIAELLLLITTMTSAIVALLNTRSNATAIDKLKKDLEGAERRQDDARKDIILIGESLHEARMDNAVIAEAFNQLFIEFKQVTGHRPAVNLDRLRHMTTLRYITGPLEMPSGPLEIPEQ